MARDTNKRHAERLRHFTEQSNAVHEQYLSDPDLLNRYERFLEWQVAYSLPFYAEFQDRPETAAAVEFVLSDLIGTGVSARDADRLHHGPDRQERQSAVEPRPDALQAGPHASGHGGPEQAGGGGAGARPRG